MAQDPNGSIPENYRTFAKHVAKETVAETFKVMGFDVEDPFEVQKDMAHLRFWRLAVQNAATKVVFLGMAFLLGGAAVFGWMKIT